MAIAEVVNSQAAGSREPSTGPRRPLTDVEVAARLGVSRYTVRSWRLKGTGPRFLKMGRAVRYRAEDVSAYERQVLVVPDERTNPSRTDASAP
jgi:excisionase family DNA binding protein